MSKELDDLQALRNQQPSLQMLEGALGCIGDPVVVVGLDFTIAHVNDQTIFVFGYNSQELLGQHINILIPDTLKEIHLQHLEEFRNHPHPRTMKGGIDLTARRKDGSELRCRVQITPYSTEFNSYVCAQIRVL